VEGGSLTNEVLATVPRNFGISAVGAGMCTKEKCNNGERCFGRMGKRAHGGEVNGIIIAQSMGNTTRRDDDILISAERKNTKIASVESDKKKWKYTQG
jgi:hypothetical protein